MKKIEYINAGAGSGKTHRLTHMLSGFFSEKDPRKRISPSEVIVTTFTKAAAEEIKERARQVLIGEGRIHESTQLDTAAIGTVHAVSQMFLNKYWYWLGACPNQEVITEEDKAIYRNLSLVELFNSQGLQEERKAIDLYVKEFCPKKYNNEGVTSDNPEFWAEHIERMVGKISYYEIGDMEESINESGTEIGKIFSCDVVPDPEEFDRIRKRLLKAAADYANSKKGIRGYGTWKKFYNDVRKISGEMTFTSIRGLSALIDRKKNKDWPLDMTSESQRLLAWQRSARYGRILMDCVKAVFRLSAEWRSQYETFKKHHGVIDYDDMEKSFLQLLRIPQVQQEIARDYKLMMVDEFQDCNPMQLKIFDSLSEIVGKASPLDQSSIWVGDPKQAIYGFRGSDTDLINRVGSRFPKDRKTVSEEGLKTDFLDKSYRSRENLVKMVNNVFGRDGFFPEMVQLEATVHEQADYAPASVHWIFEDSNLDGFFRNLARQVRHVVEEEKPLILPKGEDAMRPLEYRDIAVLARTGAHVSKIALALRQEGVPVSSPEKDLLERAEVQLLLSLMNEAEHKEANAHERASLLRLWSGWKTEEVLRHRLDYLRTCKEGNAGWLDDETSLQPVYVALGHASGLPLDQMVRSLILELGLYDHVSRWGEAETRRQNLQTFMKVVEGFMTRCARLDLHADMRGLRAYLKEVDIKPEGKSESAAVRVCTYHGSKGLEWPMVILASLEKNELNTKDIIREYWGVHEVRKTSDREELLPEYGIHYIPAPVSTDWQVLQDCGVYDSEYYHNAVERVKGEMMRLMYVGMTRARDYLVLASQSKGTATAWLDALGMQVDEICSETRMFPKNEEEESEIPQEYYRIKELPALEERQFGDRFLNPSCLPKGDSIYKDSYECIQTGSQPVELLPESERQEWIPRTTLGTCVHNIFAACPSDGSAPTREERESYVATVGRILSAYRLEKVFPKPEQLADSLYALYAWLTKTYGTATEILHECPFSISMDSGEVINGEIDLIWKTAEGEVIVDFKNHFEEPDAGDDTRVDDEVVRRYVPQLSAYSGILRKAGRKVSGMVLYFDLPGYAVIL